MNGVDVKALLVLLLVELATKEEVLEYYQSKGRTTLWKGTAEIRIIIMQMIGEEFR